MAGGATERVLVVSQVAHQVGSGMDGQRRKLARILSDATATVIVVEHRRRTDDLAGEVTGVLTSVCARSPGLRATSRRAVKPVAVVTGEENPLWL